MEKITPRQFLEKSQLEGGGIHFGFCYGLNPEDLDDSMPEYKKAVQNAYELFLKYGEALAVAERILSIEDFEEGGKK